MPGISLPQPISIAPLAPVSGEPTYTDIFNATVGAAPDPSTLDPLLAEALTLALGLEAEVVSGALDGSIFSVTSFAGAVDSTLFDGHMADYVAAMPTGTQALTDLGNQSVPALLQLPISASFNGALGAPPTQQAVNLGTVPLGSNPITIPLGSYVVRKGQTSTFVSAYVADGNPSIYMVEQINAVSASTDSGMVTLNLIVTPQVVGTWVAQLDITGGIGGAASIITYTITVAQ
jgi:hypothetical protein